MKFILIYQIGFQQNFVYIIFRRIFFSKKRMSSFLDRFVGKTQTISKLGPQTLFKINHDDQICTNTHKSFARSSTHQRLNPRNPPRKIQKQEDDEDKNIFHLPHLQQRYLNAETKKPLQPQSHLCHSKMQPEKDTNWLLEQPQSPAIVSHEQQRGISSVDPHKENIGRIIRQKDQRRLKSQHLQKSSSRLGGLGPNIGGQQWLQRKERQQKAKKYAVQIKKIQRQKLVKQKEQSRYSTQGNKVLIYY